MAGTSDCRCAWICVCRWCSRFDETGPFRFLADRGSAEALLLDGDRWVEQVQGLTRVCGAGALHVLLRPRVAENCTLRRTGRKARCRARRTDRWRHRSGCGRSRPPGPGTRRGRCTSLDAESEASADENFTQHKIHARSNHPAPASLAAAKSTAIPHESLKRNCCGLPPALTAGGATR